jgi:hypothetical protein
MDLGFFLGYIVGGHLWPSIFMAGILLITYCMVLEISSMVFMLKMKEIPKEKWEKLFY